MTRDKSFAKTATALAAIGRRVLRARLGARHERELQRGRVAPAAAPGYHGELGAQRGIARDGHPASATTAAVSSGAGRGKPSAETLLHLEIAQAPRRRGGLAHALGLEHDAFGRARRQSGGLGDRGLRDAQGAARRARRTSTGRWMPIVDNDQDMTRLAVRVARDARASIRARARVPAAPSRAVHLGRDAGGRRASRRDSRVPVRDDRPHAGTGRQRGRAGRSIMAS